MQNNKHFTLSVENVERLRKERAGNCYRPLDKNLIIIFIIIIISITFFIL